MSQDVKPATGTPAVVLLSGGLDSSTLLAWAVDAGYACHALSFRYGQRHEAELGAARQIAAALGAVEFKVLEIDLAQIGGSALTDLDIAVPTAPVDDIPITYVPARNTIFLALALGWAETINAFDLFIGVNAVDYSGYPDCRPEYISAFQTLANLATRVGVQGQHIRLHAPLIEMSKAEIIAAGSKLGVDYAATVSCYQADADGRACRVCDSCRLRAAGFTAAGMSDPTRYQP